MYFVKCFGTSTIGTSQCPNNRSALIQLIWIAKDHKRSVPFQECKQRLYTACMAECPTPSSLYKTFVCGLNDYKWFISDQGYHVHVI